MIDPQQDRIQAAARELVAALRQDAPRTATTALAEQLGVEALAYRAAVDHGHVCPGCGGRDGLIVTVRGDDSEVGRCVTLWPFRHRQPRRLDPVVFDVEAAKQLVNRLGEAIAAAEALP